MLDRTVAPEGTVKARIDAANADVARRVREARVAAGLSQAQLGAALDLTFQQVQKYEKGKNRISAGALEIVAEVTGRDIAWFHAAVRVEPVADCVVVVDGQFVRAEGLTPYVDEADRFSRQRALDEARRRPRGDAAPVSDFSDDRWRSRASLVAELEQLRKGVVANG